MDDTIANCIKCQTEIKMVLSGNTHYPFCDECFKDTNRAQRKLLIREWRGDG